MGLLNAVKSIFAKEGVRGMYAGYGSFLLRDLPFDAIEFLAYEQLRKAYKTMLKDERSINGGETAVIGKHYWMHKCCNQPVESSQDSNMSIQSENLRASFTIAIVPGSPTCRSIGRGHHRRRYHAIGCC